jgi:membrane fusion protein, multidrug efflux system
MSAPLTAPVAETAASAPRTHRWWAVVRSAGSVVLALAGLVLFLAWMGGAFREKVRPAEIQLPHASAAGRPTARVEKRQKADLSTAVGSVQPRRRTEVASQLLARILDVKARPGDLVEAKQELVLLDDRELIAQQAEALAAVTAAEADLIVRRADFNRAKTSRDKGVISLEEFARFEGALKVAEAQLKRAQQAVGRLDVQLTYTKIVANARGVVGDRFADPGDIATPGKPLMVLYDPAELELHANVPESLADRVKEGRLVTVRIEAAGLRDVTGTVREVVPRASGSVAYTRLVKVTLGDAPSGKQLLPGMFGRLTIPVDPVNRLYVPRAAVIRIGQLDLVEVVAEDGTLSRRFVRIGPEDGDSVEVLTGLSEGDVVALPAR